MKYLMVGAGGTGGSLSGFLAAGGKDVSLVARGVHLDRLREEGLTLHSDCLGNRTLAVRAFGPDDPLPKFDVIFVCVKNYSLESVFPILRRASDEGTILLPILNGLHAADRIAKALPDWAVYEGCVYVTANREEPGVVRQQGNIFRVVFGSRQGGPALPEKAKALAEELESCGIRAILSDHIQRDIYRKFSLISAHAATAIYHNAFVDRIQQPGPERETFEALLRENINVAQAMGIRFDTDLFAYNMDVIDHFAPGATASAHRDVLAGRTSEVDDLVFEVARLGHAHGVPIPVYERIARSLGYTH